MHIFLYGPPAVGKTTLGHALAQALNLPFVDLDEHIQAQAEMDIPQIFAVEGEAGFRERELVALADVVSGPPQVIALGGGALLDPRALAIAQQNGQVLCLRAAPETLLGRLAQQAQDQEQGAARPLLAGDPADRLLALLEKRAAHYANFPLQLDVDPLDVPQAVWQAQVRMGAFTIQGMGEPYDVRVGAGLLDRLGVHLQERGLKGPLAVVSDRNIARHYQERTEQALRAAGYQVSTFLLRPGESQKTVKSMAALWQGFLQAGVERGSTVVALGGGVVGDLTGFAAATFLRGVPWVNVPTTLLAMVDSSLGGKTGVDLPQGKNLVGAFHPPRAVMADPAVLATLPRRELRSGLAEVVKHGVIQDPELFALCERGWRAAVADLERIVRQAMAVKVRVIEADPYEKGLRQALNLGHTIGHGVELASNFHISHGEAVAIGMVAEARLAEALGVAHKGLAERMCAVLAGLGLPTEIPADIALEQVIQAMQFDKKKQAGKVRFALPARIGDVRTGIIVEDWPAALHKLAA